MEVSETEKSKKLRHQVLNPIQVRTFFKPGVLGVGHMAHPMYFFLAPPLKGNFVIVFLLVNRGPRVYLGKVKKSQGVICRISALKLQIKIRWAIWPPPILNRVNLHITTELLQTIVQNECSIFQVVTQSPYGLRQNISILSQKESTTVNYAYRTISKGNN